MILIDWLKGVALYFFETIKVISAVNGAVNDTLALDHWRPL
jgi:hypothetical protein